MGKKLRRALEIFIMAVQKIVITLLLGLLYIIGFGLTAFFALIFNRKILRDAKPKGSDSYWEDAEHYEEDLEQCTRQS